MKRLFMLLEIMLKKLIARVVFIAEIEQSLITNGFGEKKFLKNSNKNSKYHLKLKKKGVYTMNNEMLIYKNEQGKLLLMLFLKMKLYG